MIAAMFQAEEPSFRDNEWLDEYQFHFGEWLKQIVDWTDQNLGWLLSAIIWPFNQLFDLLLSTDETRSSLTTIPWYWIVIAFFIIGSVARNTKVGVTSAVLVAACGLLGPGYWEETVRTFGMIFVSVLICALIGIPLGILCGRVDAVWNVARPVLDAMQVVHPFVYMLPFVFFWSVGEESATMATMVFALPPLVRLTNLGVRQVPEDVVEASRSFGANELRVLTDVQLPLARPAIMTGLNQTLLMAVSMLGIAAIMGAGGIGKLLLQAINSFNIPQATSGGLTFFFIAVVLDRISQSESDDGIGLLGRIREAYAYRSNPQGLLDAQNARSVTAAAAAIVDAQTAVTEAPAPIGGRERMGLMVAAVGSLAAIVAVVLPWSNDAGLVSSWGRRIDEVGLQGMSFAGYEASGGSIFALVVLGLSVVGLLAAVRPMLTLPSESISRKLNMLQGAMFAVVAVMAVIVWLLNMLGQGFGPLLTIGLIAVGVALLAIAIDTFVRHAPRLGADGAVIASIGALGAALGYLVLQPSQFVEQHSHGIGVYLAVLGTAAAVAGSVLALSKAPYGPRSPLTLNIRWSMVVGVAIAAFALWASTIAPWLVDERVESLMTPELQARIDFLQEEARNDVGKAISNSQEVTNIFNSLQSGDAVSFNGIDSGGPRLGIPTAIFALLAGAAALLASGITNAGEQLRWRASTLAAGFGLAAMAIPASWIFSFTRSAEPRALTGNGAFFTVCSCFVLFAIGRGVVSQFRRRKVYSDFPSTPGAPKMDVEDEIEIEGQRGIMMAS